MNIKSFLKRVIPAPARSSIRRAQRRTKALGTRTVRSVFRGLGFNVARRSDFYSPLPDINRLRERRGRWDKPSSMAGIEFDVPAMKNMLSSLVQDYLQEYQQFPSYEENARRGFGPGYTSVDAAFLYMMLRRLRPKRYLEVGSGLSTWYAHLAATRNQKDGAPWRSRVLSPIRTRLCSRFMVFTSTRWRFKTQVGSHSADCRQAMYCLSIRRMSFDSTATCRF